MKKTPNRSPDVRLIKKSSSARQRRNRPTSVAGERVATATGYRIPGFSGKSLETFYEMMLASTSTAELRHPTKDRTLRVLSGSIFVISSSDDTEQDGKGFASQQQLSPGDEAALERGTTYRIATSTYPAEMYVSQQAKYELSLEVVKEVMDPVHVPESLLEQRSTQPVVTRRGSKARQQSVAYSKRVSPQVMNAVSSAPAPESAGTPDVINVKPSGGRFDEAGAG